MKNILEYHQLFIKYGFCIPLIECYIDLDEDYAKFSSNGFKFEICILKNVKIFQESNVPSESYDDSDYIHLSIGSAKYKNLFWTHYNSVS